MRVPQPAIGIAILKVSVTISGSVMGIVSLSEGEAARFSVVELLRCAQPMKVNVCHFGVGERREALFSPFIVPMSALKRCNAR
jgi:hypothetical protein